MFVSIFVLLAHSPEYLQIFGVSRFVSMVSSYIQLEMFVDMSSGNNQFQFFFFQDLRVSRRNVITVV